MWQVNGEVTRQETIDISDAEAINLAETLLREAFNLQTASLVKDGIVYETFIAKAPVVICWEGYPPSTLNLPASHPSEREATEDDLIGWAAIQKLRSLAKPRRVITND